MIIRLVRPRKPATRRLVAGALLVGSACVPGPSSQGAFVDVDGVTVYGRASYDWRLRALTGEEVDLRDVRDQVLFINMWASWCIPCIAEMASIERLHESVDSDGITFLIVSPEQEPPIRRFLQRYPYELPIYRELHPMPREFGLRALPTTFVVDRAGRIVLLHRGAAEWDSDPIREFLTSLAGS